MSNICISLRSLMARPYLWICNVYPQTYSSTRVRGSSLHWYCCRSMKGWTHFREAHFIGVWGYAYGYDNYGSLASTVSKLQKRVGAWYKPLYISWTFRSMTLDNLSSRNAGPSRGLISGVFPGHPTKIGFGCIVIMTPHNTLEWSASCFPQPWSFQRSFGLHLDSHLPGFSIAGTPAPYPRWYHTFTTKYSSIWAVFDSPTTHQ